MGVRCARVWTSLDSRDLSDLRLDEFDPRAIRLAVLLLLCSSSSLPFQTFVCTAASLGRREALTDTSLARFIERITPAIDSIATEISLSAISSQFSVLYFARKDILALSSD